MIVYSFNKAPSGRLTFHWIGFTTAVVPAGIRHPRPDDRARALAGGRARSHAHLGRCSGRRWRWRWRGTGSAAAAPTDAVIFTDIAAPEIVLGASLLSLFISSTSPAGWSRSSSPTWCSTSRSWRSSVRARLQGLDRSIEKAAADLGAGPVDDVPEGDAPADPARDLRGRRCSRSRCRSTTSSSRSSWPGQTLTFPLWVYGAVKVGIPPQVFVMGTLIFLVGIGLAIINAVLQRRSPA